jgi:uroporphyrinogen decarboxylase
MNSLERVTAALKREALDKVPHFEWLIDKLVVNALMPGGHSFEEFSAAFTDAVCLDINYSSEDLGDGTFKDEWGMIKKYTKESHSFPVEGPIHNMEELEAYTPPDPYKEGRYKTLKEMLEKYGKEKAVILHMNDIWSIPSRLMAYEDFLCNIMDEPEFIKALVKMTVDVQILMAQEVAKTGCKFIYTGDDVADSNGPTISPSTFEEIFYPELKRIIGAYKDLGFFVLKHCDGYLMPLLDFYLNAGIDLLDPIDPIAGMDLKHIKDTYGSRIAIKGNVNCATTLVFGTVDETVAETKYCLDVAKGTTGYVCSSSNPIHSSVNPANYKAMLEVIDEYGRY